MILDKIVSAALANHLWQSTVFALIAGLLAFALRKNRAETRYWLWLAGSLKFLTPFSLLIAIGSEIHWPSAAPVVHSTFSTAVQQIQQPFAPPKVLFRQPRPVTNVIPAIVFAIWLSGFAVVLLSWARSSLRILSVIRCARPFEMQAPIQVLSSESPLEPGVFGIFRPVLLLPAGITDRLEPSHLQAILVHELCHVRRRDNLFAAGHMLVEAIFWFHPLVWWIGSRLVEERERACDEEVVRLGNQPHVYAESILKTCQFFVESPLTCMSGVTGADLKKRIVHIMGGTFAARLTLRKKMLPVGAGIAALALPLASGLINAAQAGDKAPATFEVVSVKPSAAGKCGPMLQLAPGGRIRTPGISPKFLIEVAYDVKDSQVEGGPPWINSECYDIEAKADDSVGAALDKLPPDQRKEKIREMMQSLLRDRFKLAIGHTTKELPVYMLVVAKNGPKVKPSDFKPPEHPGAEPLPPSPSPRGGNRPRMQGGLMMRMGHLESTGVEMPMLVGALSMVTHRVVIDKTGLSGRYDFTLNWTPDETQLPQGGPERPGGPGGGPMGPGGPPPESNGPDLFTAIQEQLGLKLEAQKAPVDVLMIQHVEKPSEN
ncbi:MAG: M56 family metallopeptidase [Bryobacteraceae bacterium]